jgi:hypothetical protein
MRLEHPVAKLPEDLDRVCAHIVVVLDNENPLFAPPGVDAVLPRNLEISGLEPRLLNRCILRSDERSRRFGEPHRNAHGGDPLQRCAVKIRAPDGLDLKIQTFNCVGLKFLPFQDQRPNGRQTISFGVMRAGHAPTGGRFDAAD